jgi:hypothetical protein
MSRRELVKRSALAAGALLGLALAVVLALLAVDVVRWQSAITSGDVRYRVAPQDPTLWKANELAPFGLAGKMLATRDDIAFRLALRALRLADLDEAFVSVPDPEVAIRRNGHRPTWKPSSGDGDRVRRSRAPGCSACSGSPGP